MTEASRGARGRRPSFQFYPGDWRANAKLRRCSEASRGAWVDILCVLHDCDEYGVCRWPLDELARVAGVPLRLAKELAQKEVLKGADRGPVNFVHVPRHAGKDGEPVTLVSGDGPCWFSSRMVRDEWVRNRRGAGTRFTAEEQPSRSPTRRVGDATGDKSGDGPSSASSSASAEKKESPSLRSGESPPLALVERAASQESHAEVSAAFVAYNAIAAKAGWPHAQQQSQERKRHIRARLHDVGGLDGWVAAMKRAARSEFLLGTSPRTSGHENWRPDLDWFLKSKNFTRLMEGSYDDSGSVQNGRRCNGAAGRKRSVIDIELAGMQRSVDAAG